MEEPNKRKKWGWGGAGRDGGRGADTTLEKCHQTLEGNGKNNKFPEGKKIYNLIVCNKKYKFIC
jgi:hypothetical protein